MKCLLVVELFSKVVSEDVVVADGLGLIGFGDTCCCSRAVVCLG